jgi:DNA modification methylase
MMPYFEEDGITIYNGNAREVLAELPADSVQCCVTSPPYWGLRDYGAAGQIGLEAEYPAYVRALADVFRELRRVLRPDGTLWLNLGDSYATGAGKVGECPGGGEQGEKWKGYRGDRPASGKHGAWEGKHPGRLKQNGLNTNSGAAMGPEIQPNRMPQPGLKAKDLCGIPWRVAFALQEDGWYLRSDIIWHKPNPMPESTKDRPTKTHEYLFLMSRSRKYYYNAAAIAEKATGGAHDRGEAIPGPKSLYSPNGFVRDRNQYSDRPKSRDNFARDTKEADVPGASCRQHRSERTPTFATGRRNKRSVWTIPTQAFPEAHFATFPEDLVTPCILAGSPPGGLIIDPFSGAGTVGVVARRNGNPYIGIELNPEYCEMQKRRLRQGVFELAGPTEPEPSEER